MTKEMKQNVKLQDIISYNVGTFVYNNSWMDRQPYIIDTNILYEGHN